MKSCAYCGRENLDNAAHCTECGTDEFAGEIPPTKNVTNEAVESAAKASESLRIEVAARAEMENEHLKIDLPKNHYLQDSTDEELIAVVAQSSEWSAFDVAHARRLIGQRGIDLKKVENKRAEHIHQLRGGKRASKRLIFFGWFFVFLGGLIGVAIAWSLAFMKEKTPYGEFFAYDEESRAIGIRMLKVGGVVFAAGVVLRLVSLLSR